MFPSLVNERDECKTRGVHSGMHNVVLVVLFIPSDPRDIFVTRKVRDAKGP